MLDERRKRISRVVTFSRELFAGLRRDHGALWLRGRVSSDEERGFVRAMDALLVRFGSIEEMLAYLDGKPPDEALPVLGAIDLAGLVAEVEAVRQLAARLRPRQAPIAPGAGPGLRPPGPGGPHASAGTGPARVAGERRVAPASPPRHAADQVLGLLRRWTAPPTVERLSAPATAPAESAAAAALTRARQAFEAAHKLAGEILAYVSPRLQVLEVALTATGLPGHRRPMDVIKKTLRAQAIAAGVPEPQMSFLPPLVKLFDASPDAVRRVHPALVQWGEVRALAGEARLLQGALRGLAPSRVGVLLAAFETGRYRAAIYPLTHLHLTFRGLPIASELFPPPAAR